MVKIEEASSTVSGMPRWQAERAATKLNKDIQQLKVAMGELDTVRPKRVSFIYAHVLYEATCVKHGNVFFMEKRDVIIKTKRNELKDKEKLRFDLGIHLRSAS